ncbi:MAG: Wzz/FepE/Etk N-terminal domain-containing protein [Candidatus Sedimenticola sp. (ex Thyasira tokunagai)]
MLTDVAPLLIKIRKNNMDKNNNSTHPQNLQFAPLPYPYYPPHVASEGEISLVDLFRILAKRKVVIVATTLLVTLATLSYALITPTVYNAEAIFLPPSTKDIQLLNVQGVQGVQGIDVTSVYDVFKKNLNSRALLRRLVEEQELINILAPERTSDVTVESILEEFAKMLEVNSDKKNGVLLFVSLKWREPEQAAAWVNHLSALADRVTVQQLTSDLVGAIDARIRNIESAISSKRQLAKQRREDQLAGLEEALQIAQSLGISESLSTSNVTKNAQPVRDLTMNSSFTQPYNRGTKALHAEILVLRNRKSDDAFISGLRDLQEELSRLQSIRIDEKNIHSMTIDQAAFPPSSHVKPKRKLIVVLGIVLGLILGVFAAFFMHFLDNLSREEEVAV